MLTPEPAERVWPQDTLIRVPALRAMRGEAFSLGLSLVEDNSGNTRSSVGAGHDVGRLAHDL